MYLLRSLLGETRVSWLYIPKAQHNIPSYCILSVIVLRLDDDGNDNDNVPSTGNVNTSAVVRN
jgi:hypothetical protein